MNVCNGKINSKIIFLRHITGTERCFSDNISNEASDFILKLLTKDPRKRLGGGKDGAEDLKRHPFFKVRFSQSHVCIIYNFLESCLIHSYIC
jgi:serine/threonine protein kinase